MKAVPWKKIASKPMLDHPRIKLTEDTVELPDGKIIKYIRHRPVKTHSVAVIAINDNRELLLQREYSYPPNEVLWQLPGGSMDKGENPLQAANRELSEESNMTGSSCQIIGQYYVNNRRTDEKQYVVVCKNLRQQNGQRDVSEFIETHWLPLPKVRSMMQSGEFMNVYLLAALSIFFNHM